MKRSQASGGGNWTLVSFRPGQRALLRPDKGEPEEVDVTSLGASDQVLAVRPGAGFVKRGRTFVPVAYSPDVQPGISGKPNVDSNPYNFAEWIGDCACSADDPASATHDRDAPGRLNGRIRLTYVAETPVFVPSGEGEKSPEFFRCWNGERTCPAIPGSTLKGVVRTLFEILTNSRLGVSVWDRGDPWADAPLYRRRASKLYRIVRLPTRGSPGQAEMCSFEFLDGEDARVRIHRRDDQLTNAELKTASKLEWNANLLWVAPRHYRHGPKRKLAFLPTGKHVSLSWNAYQRFRSMRGHAHLERLWMRWSDGEEIRGYVRRREKARISSFEKCMTAIFDLSPGDLVFGIEDGGDLACFGRNVNFLWPPTSPPAALAVGFLPRAGGDARLEGSDATDVTFGFIGDHGKGGHPFRGRTRFTMLWGDKEPAAEAVSLMPLVSPAGDQLKSRTLYYAPDGKRPSGPDNPSQRLRGRKLYWHQRPHQDAMAFDLPAQHVYSAIKVDDPDAPVSDEKMRTGANVKPCPIGTRFTGYVHFSNLTPAELGALLGALDPRLLFGPKYGIRVGKGKPRGLGSLMAEKVELSFSRSPTERYAALSAETFEPPGSERTPEKLVARYKEWAVSRAGLREGADWSTLRFARDLELLLRIPDEPSVRVYPISFAQYGWAPEFDVPDGGPGNKPYPRTMARARDLSP